MTQEIDLPPLPQQNWCETTIGHHSMGTLYYFTADQMREYAMQAVKDERERCAKLCDRESDGWLYGDGARAADACAAAIRQSK